MEMMGSKEGEPQKSNIYQAGDTSHQSQGTQRKSEPQYNDVLETQSDYVTYESYESQENPILSYLN